MAKIHNNVVARDAKKEYKTFVTLVEEKMDYFLTDPEIQLKHLEAERKALDYFSKHQMGDDESNTTILNELNKVKSKILFLYYCKFMFIFHSYIRTLQTSWRAGKKETRESKYMISLKTYIIGRNIRLLCTILIG